MPDITPIINSFNAGELSPLLDARTDLKKYYSGCRTLQNFIATPYGGAVRRPGTYYVAEVKDSSKETRLIPFEYNVAQAYILEFGNQYIRFYKNKGQIVYTNIEFNADPDVTFEVGATMTGGTSGATAIVVVAEVGSDASVYTIKYLQGTFETESITCGAGTVAASSPTTTASTTVTEIVSPYLEADLPDLHFIQSADVLYIVDNDGGYQPRKLSRYSHDHWVLEAIDFDWGPFLDNNTEDITITPTLFSDVTSGETFTASNFLGGFPASMAFDDIVVENNGWVSSSGSVVNQWIAVQFAAAKTIIRIKMQPLHHAVAPNRCPRYWKLEAATTSNQKTLDNAAAVDLGGSPNQVRIPSTAHGYSAGNSISITNTTNYDGIYEITNVNDANTFDIYSAFTAETFAGTETVDKLTWAKISANAWPDHCQAYNTDEVEGDKIINYDDWVEVGFNNSTAYKHYRFYIANNWGDGLYISLNEIEMSEASIVLTASTSIFTADHVGSIWKIAHQKTDNSQYEEITGVAAETVITLKNTCRFRTTVSGNAATEYKIQRKYDNDPDYHDFKVLRGGVNYDISWNEPVKDGADYRINCTAFGTQVDYILSCEQNFDVAIVEITSYTSTTSVEAIAVENICGTTATKLWAEGAWSDERGWPRTIGFFEGRIIYAGNTYNPLTLWFSETNNFEGMWAKTLAENENLDDDALIFTISAAQQNMIKWIIGQNVLLVGTAGAEGKLASHNRSVPLTPDNIPEYRPQSSYGSGNIQPIMVNDVILFIQRENRKLREFKYSFNDDIFIAKDLTLFAEHITEGGLNSIARQQQPNSILWAVRGDGVLLGMSYERLEEIWAWHRHVLGGTDTEVKSVAVISAAGQTTNEDEVWLIVERTVNSNTVKYVEYMKPRNWGSTDTDVFFVDCGLSAAGSGGNTYIGGLDHLEGETVDILSDGKVFDEQVVGTGNVGTTGYVDLKVGGVATASTIKLHIGLPYTSDLQPMKLEIPLGQLGTARGRTKRIHEAVISFKNTLGGYFGRGVDNLDELNHAVTGTSGSMTPLKTEEETVTFPGDYETAGNVFIRQSYPLPMTIRSIVPKLKVSEI